MNWIKNTQFCMDTANSAERGRSFKRQAQTQMNMEDLDMKKTVYILLAALAVSLCCAACRKTEKAAPEKKTTTAQGGDTKSDSKKLKVMASFYPMYDFSKKVGGDKVVVTDMVPAGTEPHDWEPAATDIKNLENADVFIYNGANMEHWIKKVLGSLDNKNLKVVEASKGLHLLKGGEEEEDAKIKNDKEGGYDPHVWLSPLNAKAEMKNIEEAFVAADPKNKTYYSANYDKYAKEFDQLDAEYKKELANTKSKDMIVAHEAFGYLCSAYGLKQIGIEGLSPDSEPDPARMNEIIKFAKDHNVKTIFFEDLVSPKVAKTIAKEVGAKVQVLNPLEGLSDKDQKVGEDYFTVMKANLQKLKTALNK